MYHIIINPASRSGKGLQIWKKQVEPALHAEGVSYRSYFSEKAGDVAHIAAEILSSTTNRPLKIILLGGDGTINEFIQKIPDLSDVILGYIPTGSSNDLARDLELPAAPVEALHLILRAETIHSMDLGTITYDDGYSHHFIGSSGIGFDAAVCENVQRSRLKIFLNKLGLGKLVYLGIALKQLFCAKSVSCTLTLDNGQPINIRSILFVACMLHRFEGGGFMFCPDADATDGYLNLCAVGNLPKLLLLLALPTAFYGKHFFLKGITPYRAQKVHIEVSAPLWTHTDGEIGLKTTSFTATCKHKGIRIIANKVRTSAES